jgi:transposase
VRCASSLAGINKTTAAFSFHRLHRLRKIITYEIKLESDDYFAEKMEVDESYFGGHRKANISYLPIKRII